MASRAVIGIMDEFGWDIERICEALIEQRDENETMVEQIVDLKGEIEDLNIELSEVNK